jgi:hypothetical protein
LGQKRTPSPVLKKPYAFSVNTPAQLSQASLDEFKAIYRAEFGPEISDDEAQEMGSRLLRLLLLLGEEGSLTPLDGTLS